jgi:hypothetical protein
MQYPQSMTAVMTKKRPFVDQPMMIPRPDNPKAQIEAEMWCEYYADFLPPGKNCMEPVSTIYYPILESLDEIELSSDKNYPDNFEVKAILAADMYWRDVIQDILPPGSNGMVLVVENDCVDDAFTYQIDGPTVKYLGVGDLHNPIFNSMCITSQMNELNSHSERQSDYTGLPVIDDECSFTFHVYPSLTMKDRKYQEFAPYNICHKQLTDS